MYKNIKLVALDLDGTLLNSKKEIPSDFFSWVKRHKDINTIIASGRQLYALLDQFHEIENNLIFVAENGLLIYQKGNILNQKTFSKENSKKLIDYLSSFCEFKLVLCGVKSAYILNDELLYEKAKPYYARLKVVESFKDITSQDEILKFALFFKNKDAENQVSLLNDLPFGSKVVSGKEWIDILSPDYTKGSGISFLQKRLNISKEDSMAFGDAMNDYEMLISVKESFAVKNAMSEVKKISKHICDSNDDNGVMKILNTID